MPQTDGNGLPRMRGAVLRMIADGELQASPPTLREIVASLPISSTSIARYHIDQLVTTGMVERDERKARGLTVTDDGWAALGVADQAATVHAETARLRERLAEDE